MRGVGIDIDAAFVRVVRVEKGFREQSVLSVEERPLAQDAQDASQVLARLRGAGALDGDSLAAALPGDRGYTRFLEVPPTDADKRSLLVRNQLDGALPESIEEGVVISSQTLKEGKNEPTQVLAAAASHEVISWTLHRLTEAGLEPQLLTVEIAALGALAQRIATPEGLVLFDLGHSWSTFVVVVAGGSLVAGRTLKRGAQEMAQALSHKLRMSSREAFLRLSSGGLAALPAETFTDAAIPMAAELRRTLAGLKAKGIPVPERLHVTGEGARLPGFGEALANLLGLVALPLDVSPLKLKPGATKIGPSPLSSLQKEDGARFARALGLALLSTERAKAISLRQGPFALRTDFTKVVGRWMRVALVLFGLLLLGGITLYARYSNLVAERDHEVARLSSLVKAVSGKQLDDLDAIDELLHGNDKGAVKVPWPETTAFDVLLALSQRIPDEVKVDVNKIDIRAKKTTISGEIDNAADIDAITSALQDYPCFKEIKQGNVKQITTKDGRQRREFTLDIDTTCP